jgi:predicted dehydrogenase
MAIGFGIIGSGYMGRTYAACLTRHVPDGRLVALTGGTRAAGLATEWGVPAVADVPALLATPGVDAVIITSPHSAHVSQAVLAAQAGRHVYLEKPMALSVAECDTIIEACRAAGVKLTVNFVTRFRHAPMAAKRLVDEGAIGELRMLQMKGAWTSFLLGDVVDEATGRVIIPIKRWAFDRAEGSQLLDWGVHHVDAMRWWTGSEVERVYADYRTFGAPPPEDLSAMVQLRLANGVMAQILMTYELPEPGLPPSDASLLIGSEGMIEVDHYGAVRLGRGDGWTEVTRQVPFDFLGDYLDPNRLAGFAAQVQDLARAILDDREPAVTGADGRAAVAAIEAADRSAATGQAVTVGVGG